MEISNKKFEIVRQNAEKIYKEIGQIKCPYFSDDLIYFNSQGFEHLLFGKWNRSRVRDEQYTRLKLIPLAIKVLKMSHTLQEYCEDRFFVRLQTNSKWNKELKTVKYYIFSAIINNALIKVVIREIEGRRKYFHSLIPKWRTKILIDGQRKRITYTGDPEND